VDTPVLELLPDNIKAKATLKIIKEHNGIIVIGAYDTIKELKDFISQIDQPVPQVLIEAIVVDFKTDKIKSEGVEMFLGDKDTTQGGIRKFFPLINTVMDGTEGNLRLGQLENLLNIKRIGRLPKNFFMLISALEKKELAKVISRPQIATLNGHPASITVGQTQYYLIKKESSTPTSGTTTTQTTEEFQTIQADMSLKVTPWVSAAGEITTEISPNFNTPRQSLDSKIPPTIDRRELSSTVRLKDGETIILGGLIRTTEDRTMSQFPLLGRIPWLGRLFRNESVSKNQSELIVYLTPHLYYGSEGSVDIKDIDK
jgi:type IV pilus assembly protein PilQ